MVAQVRMVIMVTRPFISSFILMFNAYYVQILFWALGEETDKGACPSENLNNKHKTKQMICCILRS